MKMKKLFVLFTSALLMFAMVSCNLFKSNDKEEVVVENVITNDINYMYENYGDTYVWYESQIYLNDFLDEECDGSFSKIVNVFQVVTPTDSVGGESLVVQITHVGDSSNVETTEGFWLEDMPMVFRHLTVTYDHAFQLMNQSNYPKPHSRNCVLRKEVGPKVANPQYIFGNIQSQIYVDAINGNVTDCSPSFCKDEDENVVNDTIVVITNDTIVNDTVSDESISNDTISNDSVNTPLE